MVCNELLCYCTEMRTKHDMPNHKKMNDNHCNFFHGLETKFNDDGYFLFLSNRMLDPQCNKPELCERFSNTDDSWNDKSFNLVTSV